MASKHPSSDHPNRDPAATLSIGEAPDVDGAMAAQVMKERIKGQLFATQRAAVRIDRFRVLEQLGAGGMGEVFSAYDEHLDRKVAIKLVHPDLHRVNATASQRLLREARVLAQLSHPNVVQVYDAGMHEDRVFIAMEFIRGETLDVWLKRERDANSPAREAWRDILDVFVQAGRGLLAAHDAGLMHRDFKPANVLVGDDGRVRVVDFGLARLEQPSSPQGATNRDIRASAIDTMASTMDASALNLAPATPDEHSDDGARVARMTATGTVQGTPAYMSPEQMDGAAGDSRSDQFSFCVALYEALYGDRPHSGNNLPALRLSIESGEIAAPVRGAGVPRWVRSALIRGISSDPGQRFPSMRALLAELTRDLRRRRRNWIAAAVVGIGLVAGIGMMWAAAGERRAPCAAAGSAIAAVWNPDASARVRTAFTAADVPYAADTTARIAIALDGYAAALQGERVDACRATHVRRTQPEDLLALRTACLDRHERELGALVARFESADATTVEYAAQAVAGLPDIASCRNREALIRGVRPPEGAEAAARVADIRERLARARAAELAGHYNSALTLAHGLMQPAADTGYEPVHAEALFISARLLVQYHGPSPGPGPGSDSNSDIDGWDLIWDALDRAERNRQDQLAAEIWGWLASHASKSDSALERAQSWSRRAMAAVDRIGDHGRLRAHALRTRAWIHYRAREYQRAEALQREALALALAHSNDGGGAGDVGATAVAAHLQDLGNTLHARHQMEEARQVFERALAAWTRAVGEHHPRAADFTIDYAYFLIDSGDLTRARQALQTAISVYRHSYASDYMGTGRAYAALANIEQELGLLDEAHRHALAARDIYDHNLQAGHLDRAEPRLVMGAVQFRQRAYEDALQSWQQALAIQRQTLAADDIFVVITQSNIAEALVALERYGETLALLGKVIEMPVAVQDPALHALILKVYGQARAARGRPLASRAWP